MLFESFQPKNSVKNSDTGVGRRALPCCAGAPARELRFQLYFSVAHACETAHLMRGQLALAVTD